jgi:aminopeptidase
VRAAFTDEEVERYAALVTDLCLPVRPGDLILINAEPEQRAFVAALARAAYDRGARLVDADYFDPAVTRAHIERAADEHVGNVGPWKGVRSRASIGADRGFIAVTGSEDPDYLEGLPNARVTTWSQAVRKVHGAYGRAFSAGTLRWTGVLYPTEGWARKVYPELGDAALRRLAEDILGFMRMGPDDPPDANQRHFAQLVSRADFLTKSRFRELRLRAPGTDLRVPLHPDGVWLCVGQKNPYGDVNLPNFPSEEVFTSPVAAGCEGTFRLTRPAAFLGHSIEGVHGEIRGGRLDRLDAPSEEDASFLRGLFATDRGAGRLGEIALVDSTTPIARAGRIYHHGLLDENAACHMAFGKGFTRARAEGARRPLINRSILHIDVMIGSDDVEVTAHGARGAETLLISGGRWQID